MGHWDVFLGHPVQTCFFLFGEDRPIFFYGRKRGQAACKAFFSIAPIDAIPVLVYSITALSTDQHLRYRKKRDKNDND